MTDKKPKKPSRRKRSAANPTPPPDNQIVESSLFADEDEVVDGQIGPTYPGSGRRKGDELPKPMYRATDLARILGVSDMFISRKMRLPGAPYADSLGRYDLYQVIRFFETGRAAVEESKQQVSMQDLLRAKVRSTEAQAAASEYALEIRRGNHLPVALVMDTLSVCFAAFKRVISALPAEIARLTSTGLAEPDALSAALADWVEGQSRTMSAELDAAVSSIFGSLDEPNPD